MNQLQDGQSLDIVVKKVQRIQTPILGRITNSVLLGLTYLKDKLNILHRGASPSPFHTNLLHGRREAVKRAREQPGRDQNVRLWRERAAHQLDGQLVRRHAQLHERVSIDCRFIDARVQPERLTGSHYNIASDIWSLGLSLVELVVGRYPVPALTLVRPPFSFAFSTLTRKRRTKMMKLSRGYTIERHP